MAAPLVTSVTPSTGVTTGGTSVTINGSGFTGATEVKFGSVSGSKITVSSDSQITATSPMGSGTTNISVTTPLGTSPITAGSQFTYTAPSDTSTTPAPASGSSSQGSSGYYTDPGLSAQLVSTLLGMLQNAASPDLLEAQSILLRRAALEGDIVGSRVPPPKNISEIGGYINLLTTLNEKAMRQQTLAGILGVAGPSQPLGWISNTQPLAMVNVTNDRPAGSWQPAISLTVLVRSDFVSGIQSTQKALHQLGAFLPLSTPSAISLPPAGAPAPADPLLYCGRVLYVDPGSALANPQFDPITLIRPAGSSSGVPYEIASKVISAVGTTVPPKNYDSLQCTATSSNLFPLMNVSEVPLAPIVANAGFYASSHVTNLANNTDTTWARLQNVTGLVAGKTQLGDELSLLYRQDTIAHSVFASMLGWTWNGTAFAP
jgi:hypothetical protein